MSFFDSLPARAPTPPPRRARRPAWARSDALIPGSAADWTTSTITTHGAEDD